MSLYIPTTNPVLRYTGNGLLKDYDLTFSFAKNEDLTVTLDGAPQSEGTHYDLTGTESDFDNGLGVLKFKAAPADGAEIVILRYTEISRVTDFASAARFTPDLFDSEYNQSRRIEQENRAVLANSLHAPLTETGKFNGEIKKFTPDGVIQVNATGDGFQTLQLEETQAYKDMTTLRDEAKVIKNDTQGIKDSAIQETTSIKNQANADMNQIKADTVAEAVKIRDEGIDAVTVIKDSAIAQTSADKLAAKNSASAALETERRISGISAQITNRSIPWDYTATGGETSLNPGRQFNTAQLMINGITQTPGKAYEVLNNRIVLSEPLEEGDEVFALIGDYIKPSDQSLTANEIPDIEFSTVTGTIQRSIRDRFSEEVSPEDFGAVGDGVADDADALAACFSFSKNITLLAGKTYKCSKKISLSSDTHVKGYGSTLAFSGNNTEIQGDSVHNVTIEGLQITNPDKVLCNGINFFGNCSNLVVRNVITSGIAQYGVAFQSTNNGYFNGLLIENCKFLDTGLDVTTSDSSKYSLSIEIFPAITSKNLQVLECVATQVAKGSTFKVHNVIGALVKGNKFIRTTDTPESQSQCVMLTQRPTGSHNPVTKDVVFSDNFIQDDNTSFGAFYVGSVTPNKTESVLVTGNIFKKGKLYIAGITDLALLNNTIKSTVETLGNAGIGGIYKDIRISGNVMTSIDWYTPPGGLTPQSIKSLWISGNRITGVLQLGCSVSAEDIVITDNVLKGSNNSHVLKGENILFTRNVIQIPSTASISNAISTISVGSGEIRSERNSIRKLGSPLYTAYYASGGNTVTTVVEDLFYNCTRTGDNGITIVGGRKDDLPIN